METSIIPVILSGGAGTRLWPMSRKHYPKQLLDLTCSGKTMLQATAMRLKNFQDPIVVCSEEHRFIVAEQLAQIGIKPQVILLEPVGRNTAPAIALAALYAQSIQKDVSIAVFPADHLISDEASFLASVSIGIESVKAKKLVTFGVCPTKPETGYGYLHVGQYSKSEAQSVIQFVEKPSLETAKSYVDSSEYLWNSGMFLFSVEQVLSELNQLEPDLVGYCKNALASATSDLDFTRINEDWFCQCEDISIDYALMERSGSVVSVPLDAGWSDVGNWQSLWEVSGKDDTDNVLVGDIISRDSKGCYVHSKEKLTAIIGIEDLVVVDTDDSLLISHKDSVQNVKVIPKELEQQKRTEHLHHRNVHRPWGAYDSIKLNDRYQVKELVVKPGSELSLQMHYHRAEHWIVVEGTALVTLGDKQKILSENESIYIPVGAKHRLANPGKIPLKVIEVQSGAYLGEDDIVRFNDPYNRSEKG